MFNITLSNGKEIEILSINFNRNSVDFKWINESYKGVCVFSCEINSLNDIMGQVEVSANNELVEEE